MRKYLEFEAADAGELVFRCNCGIRIRSNALEDFICECGKMWLAEELEDSINAALDMPQI